MRIQEFKLGGRAHSKKLRRAEGGAKIVGVFRMKNHDFTQKNHIFFNFRVRPPPLDPPLMMSFWFVFSILVFCVVFYTSLFVLFCWPLFCLSFELRLLITTLVSSKLFFLKVSRHLHMVGFFNGLFEHDQYNHSSKALDNILD